MKAPLFGEGLFVFLLSRSVREGGSCGAGLFLCVRDGEANARAATAPKHTRRHLERSPNNRSNSNPLPKSASSYFSRDFSRDPRQELRLRRTGRNRIRCRNAKHRSNRSEAEVVVAQLERSESCASDASPRKSPPTANTWSPNSLPRCAASQQPERSGGCGRAPRPKGETRERCAARERRDARAMRSQRKRARLTRGCVRH